MKAAKKIVIGTAQFGEDYGVTNKTGKVSSTEVQSILRMARATNIITFSMVKNFIRPERISFNILYNNNG